MQLSSLTTATTTRPVSASVESAWRSRGESDASKTQTIPSGVNRKAVSATARPNARGEQLPRPETQENDADTATLTAASKGINEELIQQQQSAGVYTAQVKTSAPTSDIQAEKRKDTASHRRSNQHYSLASYSGERANRVYLELAGQQTGRVVDEMV